MTLHTLPSRLIATGFLLVCFGVAPGTASAAEPQEPCSTEQLPAETDAGDSASCLSDQDGQSEPASGGPTTTDADPGSGESPGEFQDNGVDTAPTPSMSAEEVAADNEADSLDEKGEHEDDDESGDDDKNPKDKPKVETDQSKDGLAKGLDGGSAGTASLVAAPPRVPVPDFYIDSLTIPPFLLLIYQAAAIEYGVPWQVLAAINDMETGFGRNLNVSSAGAMGWMQFIPSSWARYGVDANRDGRKDPYNPVDAIFSAARYLRAAGGKTDLRRAVFAYNHADWYVDAVMARADKIGALPDDLVGALTGLAQGRFPVTGDASFARSAAPLDGPGLASRAADIRSDPGARVLAVNDGVITRVTRHPVKGRVVELRDVHGNVFTYSQLASVADTYAAPRVKPAQTGAAPVHRERDLAADPAPTEPASAGRQRPGSAPASRAAARARASRPVRAPALNGNDTVQRRLAPGASVRAGTVLGRIGSGSDARLGFAARPGGKGAAAVDPRPILEGWRRLESTSLNRAGESLAIGATAGEVTVGQLMLLSEQQLARRVLADERVEIYGCGRSDVLAGRIDRRVLGVLSYLASSGLRPTVTSLTCGHSYYTAAGGVSAHSSGNAVDIAAVNGTPIVGHQGEGSVTAQTIRRLLTLQGSMKPDQIISLMTFQGESSTFAMSDHADHIHVGFRPGPGEAGQLQAPTAVLKDDQWVRLVDRVGTIYDRPEPGTQRAAARPEARSALADAGADDEDEKADKDRSVAEDQDDDGSDDRADAGPDDSAAGAKAESRRADSDEPRLEVSPGVAALGSTIRIRGENWLCPSGDGSEPDRSGPVAIRIVDGDEVLSMVEPDDEGEFDERVQLRRNLLPPILDRQRVEIDATAPCRDGKTLSTGDASPSLVVLKRAQSRDNSDKGDDNGDDEAQDRGKGDDDEGDARGNDDGDKDKDGSQNSGEFSNFPDQDDMLPGGSGGDDDDSDSKGDGDGGDSPGGGGDTDGASAPDSDVGDDGDDGGGGGGGGGGKKNKTRNLQGDDDGDDNDGGDAGGKDRDKADAKGKADKAGDKLTEASAAPGGQGPGGSGGPMVGMGGGPSWLVIAGILSLLAVLLTAGYITVGRWLGMPNAPEVGESEGRLPSGRPDAPVA